MKRVKFIVTLMVALVATTSVFGQGRFGKDSAECIKYLSYYQEYMKQKNIKEASPLWRKAISLCPPSANQSMLLDGMKIMRRDINLYQNNPIRKKELIDSLLLLHDLRMTYYGTPKYIGKAKINQATDMLTYIPDQEERVYKTLGDAIDIGGEDVTPSIVVRYMNYASELYKKGIILPEDVLSSYAKAEGAVAILEKQNPEENGRLREDVENLLMLTGVASCDNLVSLFGPRYENNKEDKAVLESIITLLTSSECFQEDLFLHAVQSLNKVEPTHTNAYLLFKLYSIRNNTIEAIKYMYDAISNDGSTPEQDGNYYFELATFLYKKGVKPDEAVAAAKKTVELTPQLAGKAYFLIGSVWGSQKCEGNDVEKRAQFWIAVDYLVKAKNADETLMQDANVLIAEYSKYFPMQEDAFMFDIIDGATYTVSCGGLRESTRVRTQK